MCFFYGLLSNYHLERQYILSEIGFQQDPFIPSLLQRLGFANGHFLMLMLSVVLIAASGNIINDYFDQKADRVNKPDRVIIDKYIKRRWAIILNWTFNGIGFIIAVYLSIKLDNWWITLISLLSINLLYFYSAIYKRKFLSGNLIVAFLTAIVPLYVFVYGAYSTFGTNSPFGSADEIFFGENLIAIIGYCGFAFLLNLTREIIKDMADVKGDLLLKSETFPIRFGFKKTKYFLIGLYTLILVPLIYYVIKIALASSIPLGKFTSRLYFTGLLGVVIIFVLLSLFILLSTNKSRNYLLASNLIKVAMLFGVISALFYA